MSFYKVETYSFPIANETQPHRYIHLTATGSLGRILLVWSLNIIIVCRNRKLLKICYGRYVGVTNITLMKLWS